MLIGQEFRGVNAVGKYPVKGLIKFGSPQQRVGLFRALASKPKFVLADEPTAHLDSKTASNLLDIMEKLNYEEGITFIFSTHD